MPRVKSKVKAIAKPKATKHVVRRSVSSKTSRKSPNMSLLRAYGEQCFWVHEGPILCDLRELSNALRTGTISDAQWKHHTSHGKNDFAAWVDHVFCNPSLAKNLRGTKTRVAAATVLSTALKAYTNAR